MTTRYATAELNDFFMIGGSLAFVAGLVNSVAFIAFGGYVSHVSGHATRASIEISEHHLGVAAVFLLVAILFILGAAASTILLRNRYLINKRLNSSLPLLVESLLIAAVVWYTALRSQSQFVSQQSLHATCLYLLSFAMGMQNAMLRRSSGVIIRTTHMTGVATDMGIAMGWLIAVFTNPARGSVRQVLLEEKFNLTSFLLHATVFGSFLLGATAGTFGYLHYSFQVFVAPIFILWWHAWNEFRAHHLGPRRGEF